MANGKHDTHSETNGRLASQPSGGPAVDKASDSVVDPTFNVRDLVASAIQRQDDLRQTESTHIREVVALRADYDEKLRDAEASRIDAIRAVDVGAVNRAAEVATAQASTLATQVATSAETLRSQVTAAATAATVALAAALEPIQKDIQDLRKAQYEQQGQKAQVVEGRSISRNTGMWIGVVVGVIGTIFGMAGLIITIIKLSGN
jgi:hypothetical protein